MTFVFVTDTNRVQRAEDECVYSNIQTLLDILISTHRIYFF